MSGTAQQMLAIAQRFTFTERTTLRIWFDLDQAGHDVDADNFLQTGLILEHYQSRMDDDPNKRTSEQLDQEAQLQQAFQGAIEIANGILAGTRTPGTVPLPLVTETISFGDDHAAKNAE